MPNEDKRKIIYALQKAVYISRWTDSGKSLSAVLSPDEIREVVGDIFKELDNAGYEIVKKREDMIIKDSSIETWEKWIQSELEPPIKVENQVKYVLEAFLELIEKLK